MISDKKYWLTTSKRDIFKHVNGHYMYMFVRMYMSACVLVYVLTSKVLLKIILYVSNRWDELDYYLSHRSIYSLP